MPTLNNVCCNRVYHHTLWVGLGSTPENSQDPFPALSQARWGGFPPSQPQRPHLQDKAAADDNPPVSFELGGPGKPEHQLRPLGSQSLAKPHTSLRHNTPVSPAVCKAPAAVTERAVPEQQVPAVRPRDRPFLLSTPHSVALAFLHSSRSRAFSCSPPAPSTRQQAFLLRGQGESHGPHASLCLIGSRPAPL